MKHGHIRPDIGLGQLRLEIGHGHLKTGYGIRAVKGPDPLFDAVVRCDQLLREISGADQ